MVGGEGRFMSYNQYSSLAEEPNLEPLSELEVAFNSYVYVAGA